MRGHIHYVVEDYGSCAWYRCFTPGRALEDRGFGVSLADHLEQDMVDRADVVVFQRLHDPAVPGAIDYCKSRGKLTVYEIDDDFWNVHPDSPAAEHYRKPQVLSSIEEALRRVHVVTTTTPYLAQRLRPFNGRVHVLPNMLPDEYWVSDAPRSREGDRIVLGWAGSNTHAPDLKLLDGVVRQILEKYPQVEFAWAGMERLPFSLHERMRRLEPVQIDRYPELVAQFDIGLAPLVDTVFNRAKSDLKALEYSMAGIPVVASGTPTYAGSVAAGETGYLARNSKDWLKYIQRLVEDAALRERMGAAGREWARKRLMSANVRLWEHAYGFGTADDVVGEAV